MSDYEELTALYKKKQEEKEQLDDLRSLDDKLHDLGYLGISDKVTNYLKGAKKAYEDYGAAIMDAHLNNPKVFAHTYDIDDIALENDKEFSRSDWDAFEKIEKARSNINQGVYRPIAEVAAVFGGEAGLALYAPFMLGDMGKNIEDGNYMGALENAAMLAAPSMMRSSSGAMKATGSAIGIGMLGKGAYGVYETATDDNMQKYAQQDPLGAMWDMTLQTVPILQPLIPNARKAIKDKLKQDNKGMSEEEINLKMEMMDAEQRAMAEKGIKEQQKINKENEPLKEKKKNSMDEYLDKEDGKYKEQDNIAVQEKVKEVTDNIEKDAVWEKIGIKLRQDAESPFTCAYGKILTAKDIVKSTIEEIVPAQKIWEFVDKNFVTARTGRMRMPSANGWFSPQGLSIRTQQHNFFYTLAHEVGHYIDMELLQIKGFNKELKNGAYSRWGDAYAPGERRAEGIADFTQTYVLNPEVARQNYPQYFVAFENALNANPEVKAKFDTFSNMIRRYYSSTPEETAKAHTVYAEKETFWGKTLKEKIASVQEQSKKFTERLQYEYQDETSLLGKRLRRFEKATGIKIDFNKDPVTLIKQCQNNIGSQVNIMLGFTKGTSADLIMGLGRSLGIADGVLNNVTYRDIQGCLSTLSKMPHVIDYCKSIRATDTHDAANRYLLAKRVIEVMDVGNSKRVKKLEESIIPALDAEVNNTAKEFQDLVAKKQNKTITPQEAKRLKHLNTVRQALLNAQNEYAQINAGTYDYVDAVLTRHQANEIIKNAPKEFDVVSDLVRQYNDNLLVLGVHFGLITPRLVKTFKKEYSDYVPMRRSYKLEQGDKGATGGGAGGDAYANISEFYKQLTEGGSTRDVLDPLTQMEVMTQQLLNRGNKNLVGQAFAQLSSLKGGHELIEKLAPTHNSNAERILSVWEGGKKVQYQVHDDVVFDAINMDKSSALFARGLFAGYLNFAANTLRVTATMTPPFMIWNAVRDSFTAACTTKTVGTNEFYKANAAYFLINGMFKQLSKSQKNKEMQALYEASGVRYSTRWHDTLELTKINQKLSSINEDTMSGKSISFAKKVLKVYAGWGDMVENAPRFTEFERSIKQGKSVYEAAANARGITTDFTVKGHSTKKINSYTAFMNATIQGNAKIYHDLKTRPKEIIPRALMHITMLSVGLWALNHKEEWYRSMPFEEKMKNWHIKLGDTIYRIPKPEMLGYMFGSVPERILDVMADGDSAGIVANDTIGYLRDSTLPNGIPTGVLPIVEWYFNRSIYRGRPIVDEKMKNLPYPEQYNLYTSEVAKGIGKGLAQIPALANSPISSPLLIDNALHDMTASVGSFVLGSIDYAATKTGNRTDTPSRKLTEYTRFTYTPDTLKSREADEFRRKWDQEQKKFKSTRKATPEYMRLKNANESVKKLRQDWNNNVLPSKLDADQKREKYDVYANRTNQVYRKALEKAYGYRYISRQE